MADKATLNLRQSHAIIMPSCGLDTFKIMGASPIHSQPGCIITTLKIIVLCIITLKCRDCTSPANLSPDVLYIANSLLTDIFYLDRRYLSVVKKYCRMKSQLKE